MRTIIAGSRNISSYEDVLDIVCNSGFIITEIVSGGARGVDSLARRLAEEFNIPLTLMPAEWDTYGKRAGYKRNQEMAEYAEALIAIWDGFSPGTRHMVNTAKSLKLKIYLEVV